MRIATFNANSIRSRLDIVLRWLDAHRPDALCLQETKVRDEEFPADPFHDAGYRVVFRGEKSYNGVAAVTREEPRDVSFGLDDGGPADETRLLRLRLGDVVLVNTYVPQGREVDHDMFGYKIEWFARLRAYFDRHFTPRDLLVWTGDMNVAAEPIDVHNPEERENHVCYHADARKAFAACRSWGLEDVFRRHRPEPGQYTFFDYRTPRASLFDQGWRIDYVLATPPMATRSVGAFIDLEPRRAPRPSDHTFLAADFQG